MEYNNAYTKYNNFASRFIIYTYFNFMLQTLHLIGD